MRWAASRTVNADFSVGVVAPERDSWLGLCGPASSRLSEEFIPDPRASV